MIQIENVTKKFGDKTAVSNISLEIPSGAITGFIGPNGAGKTTTINMMTGVLEMDSGKILLNGLNIATDPTKAKKQFALIPDSPDLFLRLSGWEYINFLADIYEVPAAGRKETILKLAEDFGMEKDLYTQMNDYSHGMRQKALIMAALTCNPSIWILDEPMTGLDPSASFLLKQKMKEHASKGNTVFFSTHVLEVAEKLCDQIIMINHGSIQFNGTLENLKAMYPDMSLEDIFLEVCKDE